MSETPSGRDTQANKHLPQAFPEAWRRVNALNYCLSKIVGKYAAYPSVDTATFQRIHGALTQGLNRKKSPTEIGDYCQELRAVTRCPVAELLRPRGADDVDTKISALAQVVRDHAGLSDMIFRELLTGLLSWEPSDKKVILDALVSIVRN